MNIIQSIFIGLFVAAFSYFVMLGPVELYSAFASDKIEKEIIFDNKELISEPSLELSNLKENLENIEEELRRIKENMSDHFLDNYRNVVALIGVGLGILAAIFSGLIAIVFSSHKKMIRKMIKKKITTESEFAQKHMINDCKFKIYIQLSSAFYNYYREFFNNYSHPAFKSGTDLAIHFAEGALEVTKNINNPLMLKIAELHKIYHLTSQSILEPNCRKQETIDFVCNQIGFVNGLIRSENATEKLQGLGNKETIAWVLVITGNEREKEYGSKILREVLEHKDTPLSYQKEINENYEKMKEGKKREVERSLTTLRGQE